MSGALQMPGAGLPAGATAHEPAWVRHGSAETQQDYRTALAFEEVLLEQLTKTLGEAVGSEEGTGGEEGTTGSAQGPFAAMVPQALSGGLLASGGLGMAAQLTRAQEGVGASATGAGASATGLGASATGGTQAR